MEKLRTYLNSLNQTQREDYAKRCGTSVGYLRKAICVGTRVDGALARRLDEESKGIVSRADLRPDIWPELLGNAA